MARPLHAARPAPESRGRRRQGPAAQATSGNPPGAAIDKVALPAGAMLAPVPVVLVACGGAGNPPNLITVAWAGTVCSKPPMIGIAIMPSRHSFALLEAHDEFTVNLPTSALARATDLCGVISGRQLDKWVAAGLTPAPAKTGSVPVVAECPVNLECRRRHRLELGSHVLFIGEIVAVQVDRSLLEPDGRLALDRADLLAYAHGYYHPLGPPIDHFGFSVRRIPRRR